MLSFKKFITEDIEPFKKTVKAYKLFRTKPSHPGQLFPLFVNADKPVPMNKWLKAEAGPQGKVAGRVKSKLGDLAYRPGWHSGDLPVATHIGGKSNPSLTKPDHRPDHHVWAEVEHPADHDWQSVADSRASKTKAGKVIPSTAHITDQVPYNGHYRYKTNPNMHGNWIISGNMRVKRILSDDEVSSINKKHGVADLPRLHKVTEGNPLARVHHAIETGTHFVGISAERPEFTPQQNNARTKELHSLIRAKGYGYRPTQGKWEGGSEKSVYVAAKGPGAEHGESLRKDAEEIGKHFGQDAIYYHNGHIGYQIGTNHTGKPGMGVVDPAGPVHYNKQHEYMTAFKPTRPKHDQPTFASIEDKVKK